MPFGLFLRAPPRFLFALPTQRLVAAVCWLLVVCYSPLTRAQTPAGNQAEGNLPQSVCPARFVLHGNESRGALSLALDQLQPLAAACEARADYQAYKGALLLLLGQVEPAANALEKALLLDPNLPGAQLDYAQALAQMGAPETAANLIGQLAQRPDAPPHVRTWLQAQLREPGAQPLLTEPKARYLLQTTLGRDSNLAGATSAGFMTLYLPNGPIQVPLDGLNQPRAGGVFKTLLTAQGLRQTGAGALQWGVGLQASTTARNLGNQKLAAASAQLRHPLTTGSRLNLRLEGLYQDSGQPFANLGLSAKYEANGSTLPCVWGVGISLIRQTYPASPSLDGRLKRLGTSAICAHGPEAKTYLDLGWGLDRASSADRPGGNRASNDWMLRHERLLGGAHVSAWLRQTRLNDQSIYSPLTGDLVNHTTRTDTGLAYWHVLQGSWSAGVELETTSQKSSNSLLNIKKNAIYLGLRWAQ